MRQPGRDLVEFEANRPRLLGLAYRMLGSLADAEDAVQDTFVKWQMAETGGIRNPEAWLTSVCTNRCLDLLKSAHKKRVDYVGPWIPEPLHIELDQSPETDLERAQSLTIAFLSLMERLSPKERAAYLLHEVFGKAYDDVAGTLETSESAARQLVSRARKHLASPVSRFVPSKAHQTETLKAFLAALETGSTSRLEGLLAENVRFQTDGGGKATALRRIITGSEPVGKYVARILGRLWSHACLKPYEINGIHGLIVHDGRDILTAMTLGYDADGHIDQIYNIRNPDKLRMLTATVHHDARSGALRLDA
ncbi:RNA polymerase sigma factor SigJ [Roseibium sp. RKSG952]|uniref:RNA polymerase sigma factor SigJ n=1 Tax=Roseibium sp. RKSG952 TaxID=2529384 RepID=UPI0012BB91F8|nr:RNA polymerase sigma factor SigJ [Roseibium sp. RKSG952]MTH98866.1 sigma-70 family RNA polymerase sigma factor [Roseibium sp. RKSG952]